MPSNIATTPKLLNLIDEVISPPGQGTGGNRDPEHMLDDFREKDRLLHTAFDQQLVVNQDLNRRLVSFQGNKRANGHRWCSYKEGFSSTLVKYILDRIGPWSDPILDPFAGSGTTLFTSSDNGLEATGIELLPNSVEVIEVRQSVRASDTARLARLLRDFRDNRSWENPGPSKALTHFRITEGAYPPETEHLLGRYACEAQTTADPLLARVLLFAAMCVLEAVSYTRKDGQYLRWDSRSGRHIGGKPFNKGPILRFSDAVVAKLGVIAEDIETENNRWTPTSAERRSGKVSVLPGSSLDLLPKLDSSSFGGIITSPPYCNRYDYTRTYALELAFVGLTEERLRDLRQSLLSCTVENREKSNLDTRFDPHVYEIGLRAFRSQGLLQSILGYLDKRRSEGLLNNPGIARMVRNYFLELSLVIADCGRILRPGAPFIMVNDNVQYHGVPIPVDLILSDIAQQVGFDVEKIWILPRGKGNSSQQMGTHGRQEARKCVYVWRRTVR